MRWTKRAELLPHRVLDVELLDDGLDDDVAVTEVVDGGCERQSAEDLVALLRSRLAPLDDLRQRPLDAGARALTERIRSLADLGREPGLRGDLRDAAAHEPRSEDADGGDRSHSWRER